MKSITEVRYCDLLKLSPSLDSREKVSNAMSDMRGGSSLRSCLVLMTKVVRLYAYA